MAGETGTVLIDALVTLLAARYAADPDLAKTQVEYSDVANPEREFVFGGGSEVDLEYAAYASGTPRNPREERGTVEMTVEVGHAGWTVRECDIRCRVLGKELENLVAEHNTWNRGVDPPVPTMSWCGVSRIKREYGPFDGGAESRLLYTITYRARLT